MKKDFPGFLKRSEPNCLKKISELKILPCINGDYSAKFLKNRTRNNYIMLAYKDKPVKDQKQLEPGLIHVHHFLQTTMSCQPDAILLNLGAVGASALISKNVLSLDGKVLTLNKATPLIECGQQEAYNIKLNRFLPTKNHTILLNIGPGTRQYYTRNTTLLLKPGDLILISPHVDVFYSKSMLTEVFVNDDKKNEPETLIILLEN